MGRAMLIICAGVLVSLGIVSISTSNQGKMLTKNTVNYAEYTMAKNAAHTAIQMATQEINEDEVNREEDNYWPKVHDEDNPWIVTIQGLEVRVHTDYTAGNTWDDLDEGEQRIEDKLWFYSRAQLGEEFGNRIVEVRSHYKKRPFYELVPDFEGALQLPTDVGNFNVDGAAHEINGVAPHCKENKPPITVNSQTTKDKLLAEPLKKKGEGGTKEDIQDDEIKVDSNLDYEPTDELIERLENSGSAITVDSDFGANLGTADNPGIFFIEGNVKLSGSQKEGFGILVIRESASMEMVDSELSVAGNFTFNGLVIFENAFAFSGKGTPTINGSVLVGETSDHTGEPINIDLAGNIAINYDCNGEMYAKKAADLAVQQNKYTPLVSTENLRYN